MFETQIITLELQLATANEAMAKLTLENADLTRQLVDAESRIKKIKRSSRNDESNLRTQLATAQSRRG